jgi:hypothetical protein
MKIKSLSKKQIMKKLLLVLTTVVVLFLTNCTNINKSMREPNTRVNLEKKDFTLSDQVTGEASSTQILGIDWNRLFNKTTGSISKDGSIPTLPINIASIPVVGGFIISPVAGYALYDVMEKNKGYDVAFYPQFETTIKRPIGLGFIYKITTVKTTTRLGKLNK